MEPTKPARAVSGTDRKYVMLSLRIAGEFGIAIAAPVVLFALAGKWLDGRYGTRPMFLIAGFVLAFLLSAAVIVRKAKAFGREYESIEPDLKKKPPPPLTPDP